MGNRSTRATLVYTQDLPAVRRSAVALFALLVLAPLRTASAYCRTTTILDQPPCTDGGKLIYWAGECVGYRISSAGSRQFSADAVKPLIDEAFQKWETVTCDNGHPGIVLSNLGVVDITQASKTDRQNDIIFRDDAWPHPGGASTLAFTIMTFDVDTGVIYDADMEINTSMNMFTLDGSSGVDLRAVLAHEAGHFLGLDHSLDNDALMSASYNPNRNRPIADDVTGICSIYPPSGVRVTSNGDVTADCCDPTHTGPCAKPQQKPSGCSVGPPERGSGMLLLVTLMVAAGALRRRARVGAGEEA